MVQLEHSNFAVAFSLIVFALGLWRKSFSDLVVIVSLLIYIFHIVETENQKPTEQKFAGCRLIDCLIKAWKEVLLCFKTLKEEKSIEKKIAGFAIIGFLFFVLLDVVSFFMKPLGVIATFPLVGGAVCLCAFFVATFIYAYHQKDEEDKKSGK